MVLFGPTAVGKSELLHSLLDSRFEVINSDSMQVYRFMDIGTAKVPAEERARITYHLVDVADPREQWNAGRFVKEAESLVPVILGRGRIPLVCGGTAFYVSSLVHGLPGAPAVDPAIRDRLRETERRDGPQALFRQLQALDPDAAGRVASTDRYRVMRALEVILGTGRSLFSFPWPRSLREDMRFLLLGLERPRDELYRRIDQRVDRMFREGLLDEVKALLMRGYGAADPGMRGIGYREFLSMRSGCDTLADTREAIARSTRRFAKRQLTFFRALPSVRWVNPDDPAGVAAAVEAFLSASP